jgi:TolB-like protein/Tfp pilus assembly protein PilF
VSLVEELKRRKVLKVGGAYLVLAWLAVQVASILFPTFDAPIGALRVFVLILALGFPITVVMAWLLEATPEGLKLDPAAQGNKRIVGASVAVALLAVAWYFAGQPAMREAPAATAAATPTQVAATPAPPAVPERSIAVLPFLDMSQMKDQAYFSDGITEEILNALTRIEGLKVAGRTSSFHFRNRDEDLRSIGAQLGVSHVLEGSVRKQGDRVRITAQLIKVKDGFHVWSENYDRKLDDIFAVQDEISQAIATALASRLPADTQRADESSIDPATYDLYLRARQALADRDAGRLVKAAGMFDQVTKAAPGFDAAWSGRAKAMALYFNYAVTGARIDPARGEAARESAERALKLNPANGEALSMLAYIDIQYHWRIDDSLREIRAAIDAAPNDAEVANFAGDVFRGSGELEEALAWEKRAAELDPLADFNQSDYAFALQMRYRYRESLDAAEHAMRIDPTYWTAMDVRARDWLGLGKPAEALAEVERIAAANPGSYNELELRARIAIMQGDKAAARPYLEKLIERERNGEVLQYTIAIVQAQMGDRKAAAEWLKLAVDKRDPAVLFETEFIHPSRWPDDPAIRAVFARPELVGIMSRRARFAAESASAPPMVAP